MLQQVIVVQVRLVTVRTPKRRPIWEVAERLNTQRNNMILVHLLCEVLMLYLTSMSCFNIYTLFSFLYFKNK